MSHRLANGLVDLGHSVTMFSPSPRPDGARYEHVQIPVDPPLRTFRWAHRMRSIDFTSFDALLAQGDDYLLPRLHGPVHIRTMHGSCFDEAVHVSGLRERTRMLALGLTEVVAVVRTPVIVGVSRNSLRFYPWCRTVIPNGVESTRPPHSAGRASRPTILFVGTYARRKRGRLLHEVFRTYVRPRLPDAELWMVCDDAPEAPGVRVLGRVADDELAALYRQAWVFCLPSTYEGFGVPYIEAMAAGTPVVATPNRGAVEVLDGGHLGVITPAEQLGRALVELLLDADRRTELAARGLAAVGTYDVRTTAQQYVRLIEEHRACVR
jgi:glycosyltransferase involved in cell wall biosynthesis